MGYSTAKLKQLLFIFILLLSDIIKGGGSVPVVDLPLDNQQNVPTYFLHSFVHASHEHYYDIEIDTTSSFNSPIYKRHLGTQNLSAIPANAIVQFGLNDLRYGTKYFWRSRSRTATDTTDWNTARSFSTTDAPVITSPPNGATIDKDSFLIYTTHDLGNKNYLYQFSKDLNFNYPIYYEKYSDALELANNPKQDLSFGSLMALLSDTSLIYVRMRVENNIDTSEWSDTIVYKLAEIFAFSTNEILESQISIFPNPTTGFINVNYESKPEKINIYTSTGKKIISIHQTEKNEEIINLNPYPKGMYFMNIIYKNEEAVNRRIILK